MKPGKQGKCFGMRYSNENRKKHGVVRIEWEDGTIEEGTWYGLKTEKTWPDRHGLTRRIEGSNVRVELWRYGVIGFTMKFDQNFIEQDRMFMNFTNWDVMSDMFAYRFCKEEDKDDQKMFDALLASP